MNDRPAVLSLEHIGKRFAAVTALTDASLVVRPGTVHALLGENGAGKTTLMRIAFGMLRPDAGIMRIDGVERRFDAPSDALAAGIGMVHQHFTIVPTMTVAENVSLGARGRFDATRAVERVRTVVTRTGLVLDPAARAGDLGVADQQRLEIVKALARDARLLILDEPTAVLAPSEADDLLRWLRDFANAGRSVVLITHKLREALSIADEVTVLRRGTTVLHEHARTVDEERLVDALLGTHLAESLPSPSMMRGTTIATADQISLIDAAGVVRLANASLEIAGGEIVGVAGVEGGGHRELLRVLAGRLQPTSGSLRIPDDIGFVPEDRHRDALVLEMPLHENIALRGASRRRGRMRWGSVVAHTTALLASFDVRAPGPRAPARDLSGGNQQKLIFARELDGHPPLLVTENPTRGLDIRASAAVHEHLRAARRAGVGVVLYSSDLDEVLSLADRMLVVYSGRVVDVPVDRDAVGRAMLGVG